MADKETYQQCEARKFTQYKEQFNNVTTFTHDPKKTILENLAVDMGRTVAIMVFPLAVAVDLPLACHGLPSDEAVEKKPMDTPKIDTPKETKPQQKDGPALTS